MRSRTLGIIADDLTGAMDSSSYFASQGFTTVVIFNPGFRSSADVVVINTNSRADGADTASKKVRQAVRDLAGRMVYKKIDSTLRGNIGAELKSAVVELGCEKAIVAPAFPAVGRTTINGVLLVNGVKVAETQFAHTPISPVKESTIPILLEQSTGRGVGYIPVADIDAGPEFLYHKISEMPQEMIVCDVAAQSHLAGIAQAAALAGDRWLLCGSAGLARELHIFLKKALTVKKESSINLLSGIVLVVVGTRNQVTANQLLKARDEIGFPILDLKVEHLNPKNVSSNEVLRVVEEASCFLRRGKLLALSSIFSEYVPALKQSLPAIMAEVVAGILDKWEIAGLFLSGGDIAMSVCRRLSISAILVHDEVESGIPAGELVGGQGQGIRIITKAGGFGTEAALVKSISYLERGYLT